MVAELQKAFEVIEPAKVTLDLLAAFTSEEDFNRIGVELLVETGSYVCVAASILPSATKCWDRNQAIVGGQVVRLYKLISALLDQTCQRRRETAFVFARLAFETIVNLRFLIKHASQELFDSYVRYSLRHEKRLHDRIQTNIDARRGAALPIEERMLQSIVRTAEKSGISLNSITSNSPKNWGDKNIFERAREVGLEEPYTAVFGGGSHTVHGNWMNLLEHQLDATEGGFQPHLQWRRPRPQVLFVTVLLTVEALGEYFTYIGGKGAEQLAEPRLRDLWLRNKLADEAHERFLAHE